MKRSSLVVTVVLFWVSFIMAANNCLEFDGTDDYISVPDNASLDFTEFTIEMWVYRNSSGKCKLIGQNNADNHAQGFMFGINEYNNLYLEVWSGGSAQGQVGSDDTVPVNEWVHLVMNWKGGNYLKGYINGKNVINYSTSNSGDFTNTTPMIIGMAPWYNKNEDHFSGYMDEIRIWNDTRTEAEIRQNMYCELSNPSSESNLVSYYKFNETSGTTLSDSKGSNTGTLNGLAGTEWTTSAAIFGPKNCLDFDGSADYVEISSSSQFDFNASTDFTLEAWAKLNGAQSDYAGIIAKGNDDYDCSNFQFVIVSNCIAAEINDGSTMLGVGDGLIGTTALNDNRWHHLAMVVSRSSTNVKLYVDGKVEADVTNDLFGNSFENTAGLYIGRERNNNEHFYGSIDEVRIWNTARTAAQIRENMCKILPGNESGLVASYSFDNSSGTTLPDLTGNEHEGTLTNMDDTDWITSTAFNTWLNTSSSTWSTATNWSRGSAPASTDNVGIYSYSGGTDVILSGSPTVGDLLLSSSVDLTLSSSVTVNGNLVLESNLDLNGQTITLGSSGNLVEGSGLLSGSSGSITTTRNLSYISENVAGLGAEIQILSEEIGSTIITRSHAAISSQAIKRKYYINPEYNSLWDATFVFHYTDSELNGLTESTLALFKSEDGSAWTEQSSWLDADNNTLTLTGINSFSYWTAGPTGSDVSLPVELTDFTAELSGNAVALAWCTESETENLGFIIERAVGANHDSPSEWSQIASYTTNDALAGHGSTSEAHDYSYTDAAVVPGMTYSYRLADVDYSGTATWHSAVEVTVPESGSAVPTEFGLQKAYPNPFNPAVTLSYALTADARTSLKVYNMLGQEVATLVNTFQNAGVYTCTWQPQNLSVGIYLVRLESGNKTNLQKVVFVK